MAFQMVRKVKKGSDNRCYETYSWQEIGKHSPVNKSENDWKTMQPAAQLWLDISDPKHSKR